MAELYPILSNASKLLSNYNPIIAKNVAIICQEKLVNSVLLLSMVGYAIIQKFEMKWIENKPFTAYDLFKCCKSVTKFSLAT